MIKEEPSSSYPDPEPNDIHKYPRRQISIFGTNISIIWSKNGG